MITRDQTIAGYMQQTKDGIFVGSIYTDKAKALADAAAGRPELGITVAPVAIATFTAHEA